MKRIYPKMTYFVRICAALAGLLAFGCAKPPEFAALPSPTAGPPAVVSLVPDAQKTPSPTPVPTASPAPTPGVLRYVFLFIGDGMGPYQVQAVNETRAAEGKDALLFTRFPIAGEALTNNVSDETTDSAAAATAIATGYKTENGVLGKNIDGKRKETVAEALSKTGFKVGILTTVSLDNATPAGFFAHTDSRTNYADIFSDLVKSGFDYFAGGGFHGKSDRAAEAAKRGYTLAIGEAAADAAPVNEKLILVGDTLKGDRGLPLAADRVSGRAGQLARNTARGIARLSEGGRFFMMIEGGRIDLACHYHDAGDLYAETIDFDAAVAEAYAFYQEHPSETLIVVTADHETGDLSLAPGDRLQLVRQRLSCDRFDEVYVALYQQLKTPFADVQRDVCEQFGLGDLTVEEAEALRVAYEHTLKNDLSAAEAKKLYGAYAPVTSAAERILSDRAGLSFGSGGHTSRNVPVYAVGVGADAFLGTYENTEIGKRILECVGRYAG